MFKLLQENWDWIALGVIGAAGMVLNVIHDDKRKDRNEKTVEKAKVIYEEHRKEV